MTGAGVRKSFLTWTPNSWPCPGCQVVIVKEDLMAHECDEVQPVVERPACRVCGEPIPEERRLKQARRDGREYHLDCSIACKMQAMALTRGDSVTAEKKSGRSAPAGTAPQGSGREAPGPTGTTFEGFGRSPGPRWAPGEHPPLPIGACDRGGFYLQIRGDPLRQSGLRGP